MMAELADTLRPAIDGPSLAAFVAALRDELAADPSEPDAPGRRTYAAAPFAMMAWHDGAGGHARGPRRARRSVAPANRGTSSDRRSVP